MKKFLLLISLLFVFSSVSSLAAITVTRPNGGETLIIGKTDTIKWTDSGIAEVKIEYSVDNGANWLELVNNYANTGAYAWSILAPATASALVKVSDASSLADFDVSDGVFNIIQPSITLTAPNGGNIVRAGSSFSITWAAVGISKVKIEYTTNGVNYNFIDSSAAKGSYSWTVPNVSSGTVKVRVSDLSNSAVNDESDANFTIINPVLTLTIPNGGERWRSGTQHDITWTSTDVTSVKIEYTTDDITWTNIANNVNAADNKYTLTVPNVSSGTVKIKITDNDYADITDVSESVLSFLIPSITLTAPNGGENLRSGTQYDITWASSDVATVKIEYTTDDITWTNIANNVNAGDNKYTLTVPNISSGTVKIKVTDNDYSDVNDISNANLRFLTPSVTLTAPNGGERWRSGTQHDITWTSTDVTTLKIEYTTDDINWTNISNSVNATDNKYTLTVPNVSSGTIKIKITDNTYADVNDISNANLSFLIPSISITTPNGGESWRNGVPHDIIWTSTDVATVKIEYTVDGIIWQNINANVSASGGSYTYTPNINSETVKVRITDNDFADINSTSSANFRIFTPAIALTSPNGGENWRGGTQHDITWNSNDIAKVKIEYTTDGSNWTTIIDSTSDVGKKYTWTLPSITNSTVKIRVSKHDEEAINDVSNSDFRIYVPAITVTAPNTNVNLLAGANYQITWFSNDVTNVNIEYSTDNGTNWLAPIASNYAAASGSYTWTVQNTLSDNCLIRISKSDEPSIFDVSDTVFRIYKPSIQVVSPNGGENWRVDSTATIRWVSFDVTNVKLEYTIDDGVNWKPISLLEPDAAKQFSWVIPNDVSNNVKVKISNVNDPSIFDISDLSFRIYKPTLVLNSPNGGEEWRIGTLHDITWSSTDIANVNIDYTTDDGANWGTIIANAPAAPQKYTWNIINIQPTANIKVRISKTGEHTLNDVSNLPFTVYQPSITVTAPNGGEEWRVNSNQVIRWNKDHVDLVKLEYTTNNGSDWWQIKDSVDANLQAYTWKIPNVSSDNCKIRISKTGEPAINDESDLIFRIFEPSLSLLSPDGGEKWRVGTVQNITWTQSFISKINIEYTTNNGLEWTPVVLNLPASVKSNSYQWTIPDKVSDNCRIRISKFDEPTLKDSSSNVFTIYQKVLTLTRPIGGEEFEIGKIENITWNSQYIDTVRIDYTNDDGNNWFPLDTVNAAVGTYPWIVRDDVTNNAKIRIRDNNELAISQTSPNPFTIYRRIINIVTPNGGEAWRIGTQKSITWTKSYVTGNVRIDYSTDGGSNWLEITPSVSANLGNYEWTVQNTPSTNCFVRISSLDFPTVRDTSSLAFSIYNPSLIVTSPNGGEKWRVGTKYNITWQNNFVTNAKIEYSTNNGADWLLVTSSVSGASQSYEWTIPNTISQNCRVKVSDVSEPGIFDISNAVFEIYNPFVTVVSPNGGELWRAGSTQSIKWTSYFVTGDSVKIEFFDGNVWSIVADNIIGSSGQYDWVVKQNTLSTNCKIKISKMTEYGIYDESDSPFTVYYPYVNLTSPNGGEALRVGRQEIIKWKAGYTNSLNIEYSTNSGTDWLLVANNVVPTDTIYNWTVPNTESDSCKLRIYDNTATSVGDTSTNVFSIYKPFVTVIRPNGGERLRVGAVDSIRWNSKRVDAVSILLSTDNGLSWEPVVNSVGSVGYYAWTVPNKISTNCKIQIRNANEPAMFDYSDAVFEIYQPKVTVVSPNGGERWRMGTVQNITWTSSDINNVKIELSKDDGLTYPVTITPSVSASTGVFPWTVPLDTVDYENCKIKISDALTYDYTDVTDQRFAMYLPKLTVTDPNGGEIYRVGSSQIIRWNSKNVPNVKIEYSTDNGVNWILITSITSGNSQAYGWTIPNTVSKLCRVKITDITETTFYDISDNTFEIFQPAVQVLSPNGGEIWQAGSTKDIKWISNNIDKVKIEYSTNNGVNWQVITTTAIADSGFYSWEILSTLSSTQCKVKVTSANEEELTDASDAVFTIYRPVLALISPNGNETWRTKTEQVIKWTSDNIQNIKLEYTTNNGLTWLDINSSIPASVGSYKWVVPITPSNNCRVKISDVIDEAIFDQSDNTFVIYNPTITLTAPNGTERWKVGTKKNITWEYTWIQNVKIEYSTNGGLNWRVINANTPSINKSYQWTVEDFPSTNCLVRISDVNEATLNDSSDTAFTIYNPKITVTSPVKNDYWRSGSKHEITWSSNDVTNVKIEYSSDNGESWDPVENSVLASVGKYNWSIPYIPNSVSDSCKIRITDLDDPTVLGYSDNNFTIYEPSVHVKSPNGGEYWRIGTQQPITWKSNDINNVKIELSVNGGSEWEILVPTISAATGTYMWTIPNRESENCRIRISDVNEQQLSDVSDDNFTIYASNIKITNPTASTSWRVGELETITWTSNNVSKVKVEITTNDSTNWTQLITGLNASEGKYSLVVPNTPATTCRVKVSDVSTSKVYGLSDLFVIYNSGITVKSPNGGENWRAGTKKDITWESTNIENVSIEYSTNNGGTWTKIISVPASDKSYEWLIPSDISSSSCKIKISNAIAANVYDVSNSVFSINRATIQISAPLGGENWRIGTNHYIAWQGNNLQAVNIDYSIDDGATWIRIATEVAAVAGTYVWSVPNTVSENCRIKVSDFEDPNVNSVSPEKFTISTSGIKLTSPNGGEYWRAGTNHFITWQCSDVAIVKIEYSIDGGVGWNTITANATASSKAYNWTVPGSVPSTNCKVRVIDANFVTAFDESDAIFTIYQPNVKLIKPNGGEEYQLGVYNDVEWISNDIDNVKIEITTNNGSTWNPITGSTSASLNKYSWITTGNPSTQCKVRVSASMDATVYDISDTKFTTFKYPEIIKLEKTFTFEDAEDIASYKIISLPGDNNMPIGQIIPGTYKDDWKAFYDNGNDKDFYVEYDGSDMFNFKPGNAFWVISRNNFSVTSSIATKSINDTNFAKITIKPGWNLISNPFEKASSWSKIIQLNGITSNAIIYSYAAGWIYPNSYMLPYEGYAFYNATNNTELKIPYSPSGTTSGSLLKIAGNDITMQLKDSDNIIGNIGINLKESSLNTFDNEDILAPPGDFNKADIRLYNSNLGISYKYLFTECRPIDENGMQFEVKTKNLTGKDLNINFTDNINNYNNIEFYLLDLHVNKMYNLKEVTDIVMPKYYKENTYKILIGNEGFIESIKNSLQPKEFKLYQNYPNPFNAGTVIRYSLPKESFVNITVYDALGRVVKVLQNDKINEGFHELFVEMNNNASGVYFVRVNAKTIEGNDTFSETKKIMLLK